MASRIQMMKWLDRLIGKSIVSCLPGSGSKVPVVDPRRFLVIRPGGIGDAVHLVPALEVLRQRYPLATITLLAEQRNAAIFGVCPAVNHILNYDKPRELLAAVRGRYDVVIDTEQWHRLSAVAARLTGAPVSIGFDTNERIRLFSNPVDYSHDDYEAVSFFRLLEPLGIPTPDTVPLPFISPPEDARQRATELLAPVSGSTYLVIFPGASILERRWGADRFGELARRLEGEGRVVVVVVGGREDAADGEVIAGSRGVNLAGKTTLAETAAVIEGAVLLVSGDSGILHIGVGLGVPTVSLFGPGRQKKWGPPGDGHIVINHELTCSPCTTFGTTRPCPDHARCLEGITVDEVFSATLRLMAQKNRDSAPKSATKTLTL
jgi:ADP-heptose:LPS heptosyltransferase